MQCEVYHSQAHKGRGVPINPAFVTLSTAKDLNSRVIDTVHLWSIQPFRCFACAGIDSLHSKLEHPFSARLRAIISAN
jgi:hypothetical protein